MRLLHLADLHLGKRVNGFDFLPDQRAVLEQVLALCAEHRVGAVALAGDLYDAPVPPAAAVLTLDWFLSELAGRGVAGLAGSGNHDSAARAAAVCHCLADAPVTDFDSALAAPLSTLAPRRPGVRRVLVAHQTVLAGRSLPRCAGSESVAAELEGAGVNIGTVEAVRADRFAENGGFDYVALGHIHRPQSLGSETVRYAGSLLSYSLDECRGGTAPEKCALLVELGAGGTAVTPLPLRPPRVMRHLTGPLAALTDPDRVTDREDYIWATLTDDTPQPDALAALRAAYPNAMRLDYALRPGAGDAALPAAEVLAARSFEELFGAFFEQMQGRGLNDAERAELAALREEVEL